MIASKYVTTDEILVWFAPLSKATLWRWQRDRGFPKPLIPGKPNRWLKTDIEEWERNLAQISGGNQSAELNPD